MAIFEKAIPTVLEHEGYKSDHEDDPGGATKYGISLRFLKGLGDDGDINGDGYVNADDIDCLSLEDVFHFYRMNFWTPNRYSSIYSQGVATKCLDLAVNMGSNQANKILQRALRAATGSILVEDGIIGSRTLYAVNSARPEKVMSALKSEAAGHYRLLVSQNAKFKAFEKGWLNRAYH